MKNQPPLSTPDTLVCAILLDDALKGRLRQNPSFELAVAVLRAEGFATETFVIEPEQASAWVNTHTGRSLSMIYLHFPKLSAFRSGSKIAAAYATANPRPLLLASGPFTSEEARALLEALEDLDAVIFGEIEATLAAVVRSRQEGGAWWEEPGLWRRHGTSLERTPPRPLIENLDLLPIAITDYAQPKTERQILVGRGCNSNCTYCNLQVNYRESFPSRNHFWRSRSPRRVVDEIELLHRQRGIDRFVLNSYVFFGYDREGSAVAENIMQEILARGLNIHFSLVTHPGHLRRNFHLLPLLCEAGLDLVVLGIDSILDRARHLYGLPFGAEDIREALNGLQRQSVRFRTAYIFYDPYLTLDEIGENLSFFRSALPFYRHLDTAYSLLLHSQVLTTTLILRQGMPILKRLRNDGLLVREGTFDHEPLARFSDPLVGRFSHLHRQFNKDILRCVAPLIFQAETEKLFPRLAFFLLDALEEIRRRLGLDPKVEDAEILSALRNSAREILAPVWAMMRRSDFSFTQRLALVDSFLNA